MGSMGEARLVISATDDTAKTFGAIERHAKDLGTTLKSVGAATAQLGRAASAIDGYGKMARDVDAVAAALAKASKEAPGLKGPAEAMGRSVAAATARMRELETETQRIVQASNRVEMFRSLQPGLAKARAEFAGAKASVLEFARGIEAADAKVVKLRADLAAAKAAGDKAWSHAQGLRPTGADAADHGLFTAKTAQHAEAMRVYQNALNERNRIKASIEATEKERRSLDAGYGRAQTGVASAAAALDREKAAVIGLKREIESVAGPMSSLASAEGKLKMMAEGAAKAMEHQGVIARSAAIDGRHALEAAERARAAESRAAVAGRARGGHGGHSDDTLMGLAGLYVAHGFGHQAAETVETYREFDKERRYGKVVMGISDEEQRPLVDQAVHGGATTRFNDIQWLESQRELAARGYNKDQVMAFAPVAAQIAQALDVSMPEGVKALEGAMLGFKKDVSTFDKAQASATRTADLQVKASKISGMGFEDVQAIYKYGAAPAQMAGMSEEKMLAFGAILKKLNMGGDESGTAFRALGKNLLAPTHEAQIGLSAAGVDYSKFQRMPDELNLPGFVNTVAKEYGVKLDEHAQAALGKVFKDKDLVGDAGRFLPAVQGVLSDVLGGDDAKSKNKIAGLARRYRDDSAKGIDTDGFFDAIMGAISKNKTLANAIFGSKQGGRIFGALGDPEFFKQFEELLKEHSQGFAKDVSEARMTGFNAELQKAQGSLLNLRSAIGRAWDDDGKGGGGMATEAAAALARFTQAVAEAPPEVLRLGTAAGAVAAVVVGLKGIGLLRGGFGLNASAVALDRAAAHLMMVGGTGGRLAATGGAAAATESLGVGLAVPEIATAAAAVIGIMGAAALTKLVKLSAEAQEPGHGGQWAAPTPGTEDLDRQRLADQDAEVQDLKNRIADEKNRSKLPPGEESPNLLHLQTDLAEKENQANLLRQRLANLYVSPDREAERGRAYANLPHPDSMAAPYVDREAGQGRAYMGMPGPRDPDSDYVDREAARGRAMNRPLPEAPMNREQTFRFMQGLGIVPSWAQMEPMGPAMPPTLGKPPALPSEGGAIPVRVVSTSVDPKALPTAFTPAGMTRDFTLGNRTGNFSSPGMGTDRGFSPFPMHRAPGFEPASAHAVPVGDIAGALGNIHATVDGPVTAQVSGSADVKVVVEVRPTSELLSAVGSARAASMALSSTGSTGGVGTQRTMANPNYGPSSRSGGIGHR